MVTLATLTTSKQEFVRKSGTMEQPYFVYLFVAFTVLGTIGIPSIFIIWKHIKRSYVEYFIQPSLEKHRVLKLPGFVYLLHSSTGLYKIGQTRDPQDRLRTFNVKLPFEVEFTHLIPCTDRLSSERQLHKQFAHRRIRGEWFALTPDDVTLIKSIQSL